MSKYFKNCVVQLFFIECSASQVQLKQYILAHYSLDVWFPDVAGY